MSDLFFFRWPTDFWVGEGYCRTRGDASPAVWHPGQSISLIRVLETKWNKSESKRKWLNRNQWWLYKQDIHKQRGKKLARRNLSVFSRFPHVWRAHQDLLCHSNRSGDTSTFSKATSFCWFIFHIISTLDDESSSWSSSFADKTFKFPLFPMIAALVVVGLTAFFAVIARWEKIVKIVKVRHKILKAQRLIQDWAIRWLLMHF